MMRYGSGTACWLALAAGGGAVGTTAAAAVPGLRGGLDGLRYFGHSPPSGAPPAGMGQARRYRRRVACAGPPPAGCWGGSGASGRRRASARSHNSSSQPAVAVWVAWGARAPVRAWPVRG